MSAALSMSDALFGRRPGAGAPQYSLPPGTDYVIQIDARQGLAALVTALPLPLRNAVVHGPDANAIATLSGFYGGGGSALPLPPAFTSGVHGAVSYPVLSVRTTPHVYNLKPLTPGNVVAGGSLGGAVFTAGQGFSLQQGRRYSVTTKTSSGALPASFQGQTVASVQAQLDSAGIRSTVLSVKYSPDGTTLFIEEDHCGPTIPTSNPVKVLDGGLSVTSSYADMGAASCGAMQPAGWSTTKKAVVFGGGAAVVLIVAAAGSKAAGWW